MVTYLYIFIHVNIHVDFKPWIHPWIQSYPDHNMITTRLMVIFVRNSTNHNAHKTMLMIMIPNATAPIIKFLLYGQDVIKMSGQILISWPIYNMWQKCEKLLSSCQVSSGVNIFLNTNISNNINVNKFCLGIFNSQAH